MDSFRRYQGWGKVPTLPCSEMIKQSDFNVKYSKIVGVACGTLFPIDCRQEAHRLGLMVMYPSGSRYGLDEKYVIE